MNRTDILRLRDARDFANHALDNAGGLSPEVLADATQPQHAALYALMVVGEALGKVSPEVKGLAPELPWRPIVSLRHILVHAYWQVDLEIIADVLARDLEPLIEELGRLIAFVERPET